MELLYISFINGFSDAEYRKLHRNKGLEAISDKDLSGMNYNEEEAKEINEALANI